ncbi:hypothetical protein NAL32_00495 [Chryseobacterium sp. Ch-15]|uniref:Uncharacterized protein n=1 Tax=Chryseobacterium muglaense TaxID=2893752 RepID=A0A9Q3YR99_9FLAO|nr:hypothetical protein [Chryseobacterium muglaense]MBD3903527.1 hypothetical protein [Chryseobacterium muglaense]MCC9034599.1 hypothetical protein [Chryseobacterium muglaense]MCM2552862.1 hypothetical protein [Chryseobacterium muglaense]
MKLFLTLLFIISFALASAQNKELANEKQNIADSTLISKSKKSELISKVEKETSSDTKSNTEKSNLAQKINIVQEINTVLNYKVNKIWREDLYCLVCGKSSKSSRVA